MTRKVRPVHILFASACIGVLWLLLSLSVLEDWALNPLNFKFGIEGGPSSKFYASVLTVNDENNRPRYEEFVKEWSLAWPGLQVHRQPCYLNHRALRSYAVFSCTLLSMWRFLEIGGPSKYDYFLMFEDDGFPFYDVQWPKDLMIRLELMEESNGEVLLLGGHKIKGEGVEKLTGSELVFRVSRFYGAYAYLVKASAVELLAQTIADELKIKVDDVSNIEAHLLKVFGEKGIYISVPLLVDHNPGYSNTWGDRVDKVPHMRAFQGHRDFWNFN